MLWGPTFGRNMWGVVTPTKPKLLGQPARPEFILLSTKDQIYFTVAIGLCQSTLQYLVAIITPNIKVMITTATKTSTVTLKALEEGALRVDGTDIKYGDWRDDLVRDGYAVIKQAIPRERADKYADKMYSWLEGLYVISQVYSGTTNVCISNLGFDRNDLTTVHKSKLPLISEKGMCLHYAVTHEDFAWDIRGEPGVVGAFEKVYDTKDLLVSFDAINFGFPKYVFPVQCELFDVYINSN